MSNENAPKNPGDFDMILQNAEGQKQIYFENPNIVPNNAILDELETFAEAIKNNTKPIVTLLDGVNALKVAHQIINSLIINYEKYCGYWSGNYG